MDGVNRQGYGPRRKGKGRRNTRRCATCGRLIKGGTKVISPGKLCFHCRATLNEAARQTDRGES